MSIAFHRVAFNVTFRCTLKCKYCAAYVPYKKAPVPHYSCDELKQSAVRFFELVDSTDFLTVSGGEPFLHEGLAEFMRFLCRYRDRIGRLDLITNGTVVPPEDLLLALREAKTRVILDDYGSDLSRKADEIEELFRSHNVMYERRYYNKDRAYCKGWVDILTFSETPAPYEEAKALFNRCVFANELRCHSVIDNKIYLCPPYEYCVQNGIVEDDPSLYIDLRDETHSIEEQRKKVAEFSKIDYLPACAYCRGCHEDSVRFVPAEQLK